MLNIVVYEGNSSIMTKNINIINLALSNYNMDYRIHKYDNYDTLLASLVENCSTRKLYILDIDVSDGSFMEIVSKIRENDWESIIIITSSNDKDHDDYLCTRLMIFDFVCKNNNYEERLIDDIKMAVSIIEKDKVFTFKYNHVIYRIPCNQICYIEKEQTVKRCIIHTLDNDYYITDSINSILTRLNGSFCRTHQSCIVNLNNIEKIDLSNNMIIFKNGEMTDMLTTKMKKEIKNYIGI